MKVLCIISTPKPLDKSYGKKMTKTFVDEYKKNNPEHTVDEIDLYESHYPALCNKDIEEAINEGKGKMVEEAKKFAGYDKNGKLIILGYNRKIVQEYSNAQAKIRFERQRKD